MIIMSDIKTLPKPLIDTIAGALAGLASTIVGHPLEVVKTRLQGKSASDLSVTCNTNSSDISS